MHDAGGGSQLRAIALDGYAKGAITLFVLSSALLAIALHSGRGDLPTATLILCAAASFFAGAYMLAASREAGIDPDLAAMLGAEGTIAVSSLAGELGIQGEGWTMADPWGRGSGSLIHFIPALGEMLPSGVYTGVIHATDRGVGLVLEPAGLLLFRKLQDDYALRVPEGETEIFAAMKEVLEDALGVSAETRISRVNEDILVEIRGFRLAAGCRAVRSVSPRCCRMYPCPVCSLLACILATGMRRPFALRESSLGEGDEVLRLLFSNPAPS